MSILKSLFKSKVSEKPEDYPKIYFRWEIGGQEYGPLFFDDMITRNWSGPPIEGRFENERKWHKYDYFLKILDNLKASHDQLKTLKKYGFSVDHSNLKYRDIIKLIENKKKEITAQRVAEKEKKENLPATKKLLKTLETYGIKHSEDITRSEAKALISKYKEKERVKQILNDFHKRDINILSKFDLEAVLIESANNYSFAELLEDLNDLFIKLSRFDVTYLLPNKLNAEVILEINNNIENALFDAEDAEEQIKDREFSTLKTDYKIIGKLPKNNFRKFNKEIIEKHLQGKWNFERDIIKLVKKYFPEIKLKKEEY